MAKKNKTAKVKEPVRIRYKKLANGSQSIYLDIYDNGVRSYEFLKLYIVPERTPQDREINANALYAANTIKAQRIMDIANRRANLELRTSKVKTDIVDFFGLFKESKKAESVSEARLTLIDCAINHISLYLEITKQCGRQIGDVNLVFCEGFQNYLRTAIDTRYKTEDEEGKKLDPVYISQGTAYSYFSVFNQALAWGVKHSYLPANPIDKMDITLKPSGEEKTFLTIEEVRTLISTPCPNEETKRAFLFSCFSGFRVSDIKRLRWCDLKTIDGLMYADVVQKKTGNRVLQPIDKAAMAWLPERDDAGDDSNVFHLNELSSVEIHIRKWCEAAKIGKHVTFHTSRHTFATMLITLGQDVYVTSQLLGHKDIRMTQIYAKVVNSKKVEAISKLNQIVFIGNESQNDI